MNVAELVLFEQFKALLNEPYKVKAFSDFCRIIKDHNAETTCERCGIYEKRLNEIDADIAEYRMRLGE